MANGTDFAQRFGMVRGQQAQGNDQQGNGGKKDKVTPTIWLNIGYEQEPNEDGQYGFLSLPFGLGLDTMAPRELRGNAELRSFMQRQNNMRDQMEKWVRENVPPGTTRIMQIQVQVHHVGAAPDVSDAGKMDVFDFGGKGLTS